MVAVAEIELIQAYKYFISPLFTGCCRFHPSCASYAAESIELHGAWRGTVMAIRRLGRCRPGGGHGFDPVPRS
jgi:hypothetical protein